MSLIVHKYGGTSMGSVERIKNVARRVAKWKAAGHQVVVVPSAMSGETNRLIGLARELQAEPDPRELDVVASTGEQVTVGLLVGSQPDAFVVCHDPQRMHVMGWPTFPLPTIQQVIDRTVALGQLTNPGIRCVGIALNTAGMSVSERASHLAKHAAETGLPCVDPLIEGTTPIIERLFQEFPA